MSSKTGADLPSIRVLVVDDERNIRTSLVMCLEGLGCAVRAVDSGRAALDALDRERFDLALLDVRLGDADGLDLIPQMLARAAALTIVVMTAYARLDAAVEAVRRGAWDYVAKPFAPEQIRQAVARVAERHALRARVEELEDRLRTSSPARIEETRSPAMRAVLETLSRAAASDAAVLLCGENGTGKTELARLLHRRSRRAARPFVVVNCPTLTADLLAAELFGHVRGAFTGAVRDQPGRVEAADSGTLLLDEISEIAPPLQAKLLRFLQDKEYERIGDTTTRRADVRIVATTNRDLAAEIAAGRFREDLFHRVNVVEIVVPPLRARPEDVVPLAEAFLETFARDAGRPPMEFTPEARDALARDEWPGNVRELRNVVERATILWPAREVGVDALPERFHAARPAHPAVGGDFMLEQVEQEHVGAVFARSATAEEAARVLGIDPSTLWRKRKRYAPGTRPK